MDDIVIVALMRENPPEGLRNIITKYRGLVGKISSGLLVGQKEDIEEVIADTFISLWKNAEKIDLQKGSLKSLLIITARNNTINRWRKLKNENLVILENADTLLDESFDALNALIAEENAQELHEFINNLPEPHKEIFVRRHYLLESVKDIAQRFDMDVKQISNYLYQSKLRLREIAIKEEIKHE
jgi:RNA polymerase sigma-70 factor, ECF subfamily